LQRLHSLADIFVRVGDQALAGFRPLVRPLLIGSSGSGKSCLARQFAMERQWPFLSIDCGSFLPQGATSKPATLRLIRDHLRTGAIIEDGYCVLLMDEIDKLIPRGPEAYGSSWVLSCWSECLAALDCDERLRNHEWTQQDIARFRTRCFVLAGGCFGDALQEARQSAKRGGLGFGCDTLEAVTHSSKIREKLPEELLSRFHPDHIALTQPTRDDFAKAIEQIHEVLGVTRLTPIKTLLDQAQAAQGGMRWVCTYLTTLLSENPDIKAAKEEAPLPPRRPAFDFFTPDTIHYCQQVTDYSFELRGILGRLSAELIARQSQISRARNTVFRDFAYGPDGKRLLSIAKNARKHACACGDISDDDSLVTGALVSWADESWVAMTKHPVELTQHGLMPLFSKSWDLACRVAELRARLSFGVSMGRYGQQV
jgi:SpoVK/Ycf46/Vps4 family AAA+-type ATPase